MEKYYWDVLVKEIGLTPYLAEVILDEFTTDLDYNIETLDEALVNMKNLTELQFLFDDNTTLEDKVIKINEFDEEL